jgi:hypothetical protein
MIEHRLDANIASLRKLVFKFNFSSKSKKKNETPVETQRLRLTDAKPAHKPKYLAIILNVTSMLGRLPLRFSQKKKNNTERYSSDANFGFALIDL